jgi:hypothetical protein
MIRITEFYEYSDLYKRLVKTRKIYFLGMLVCQIVKGQ